MKYSIFDNTILVYSDGSPTYISRDSENFELIKESLICERFDLVKNLIRSENRLDLKNISHVDGRYFFREEEVPTMLCDRMVDQSVASKALLNYWINKTVGKNHIEPDQLRKLIGKTVFAIDESGFLFLTDEHSPMDGEEFYPCSISGVYRTILGESGVLGLCERMMGFSSKKVIDTFSDLFDIA